MWKHDHYVKIGLHVYHIKQIQLNMDNYYFLMLLFQSIKVYEYINIFYPFMFFYILYLYISKSYFFLILNLKLFFKNRLKLGTYYFSLWMHHVLCLN